MRAVKELEQYLKGRAKARTKDDPKDSTEANAAAKDLDDTGSEYQRATVMVALGRGDRAAVSRLQRRVNELTNELIKKTEATKEARAAVPRFTWLATLEPVTPVLATEVAA